MLAGTEKYVGGLEGLSYLALISSLNDCPKSSGIESGMEDVLERFRVVDNVRASRSKLVVP